MQAKYRALRAGLLEICISYKIQGLDASGGSLNEQSRNFAQTTDLHANIAQLSAKLERLLDSYLDQDIDRDTYTSKKAEIMSQKKSFEEKLSKLTLGQNLWLEPMKKWIEIAVSICKIANGTDLLAKKSLCLEIFGSNLILENKKARLRAPELQLSPQKNRWVLLRKTIISQTKTDATRPSSWICPKMVRVVDKCLHEIEAEISRWREILSVDYAQHLRGEMLTYPKIDLHCQM